MPAARTPHSYQRVLSLGRRSLAQHVTPTEETARGVFDINARHGNKASCRLPSVGSASCSTWELPENSWQAAPSTRWQQRTLRAYSLLLWHGHCFFFYISLMARVAVSLLLLVVSQWHRWQFVRRDNYSSSGKTNRTVCGMWNVLIPEITLCSYIHTNVAYD